jgi:hypothetical protein
MAGLAIEVGLPSMEGGLGLAGKHSVAVGGHDTRVYEHLRQNRDQGQDS